MKGPVINGKQHSLIVLRVLEWDDSGRPSKCLIGYDDTVFKLDDGQPNVFLTAFVYDEAVSKAAKH